METKFEPVMNASTTLPRPSAAPTFAVDRHRVMRNTYWLLALSLLPTVAGAWVGMQLNFFAVFAAHPIATPLLMLGAMMASAFAVSRLRNSGWGVAALLGFTFLAGVFLAPILSVAAGLRNGGTLVGIAAGMTATIFFGMAAVATVSKRDFSFLGNFLWIGLLLLVTALVVYACAAGAPHLGSEIPPSRIPPHQAQDHAATLENGFLQEEIDGQRVLQPAEVDRRDRQAAPFGNPRDQRELGIGGGEKNDVRRRQREIDGGFAIVDTSDRADRKMHKLSRLRRRQSPSRRAAAIR